MSSLPAGGALLQVQGLATEFRTRGRVVRAVDGIDFEVCTGEVFGLVGESGSGKSATCRSVLRLFGGADARITAGSILWCGRELVNLPEDELAAVRGAEIAMIFQDPMTALNPTMRIGQQIAESLIVHGRAEGAAARATVIDLLSRVSVPAPERRVDDYPHEFSGGMRQRVAIAMALACSPRLLIADEPTTALDVTIQDQILKLLLGLKKSLGLSVLLVTHDLGVIAQVCDRVAVMYAGRILEIADTPALFASPRHPYMKALLRSIPGTHPGRRLQPIVGSPPDLSDPPPGCRFAPRCPQVEGLCRSTVPNLRRLANAHAAACHFAGEEP